MTQVAAVRTSCPARVCGCRHRQAHVLVALRIRIAAVHARHKARYYTASDLIDTLYRGMADNSVGGIIESLLRNDLILIDLCIPCDYAEGLCCVPLTDVMARAFFDTSGRCWYRHSCSLR